MDNYALYFSVKTFVAFFRIYFFSLLDTSKRVRLDKILSSTSIGGSSSRMSVGMDYMSHMKLSSKPYTRKDGKIVMERASNRQQQTNTNNGNGSNDSNASASNIANETVDDDPLEFD